MSVHLSGTVGGGLPPAFGDPASLESLAGRLDALADEVFNLGHDGLNATTGVATRAGWTGTAADGYLDFCRSKTGAVAALSVPLHEIAAAVRGYAGVLAGQQRRTHLAVKSVEGMANVAADPHQATQAEWQVLEATGEVHAAVSQAANRVEAAKGELVQRGLDLEGVHKVLDLVDISHKVIEASFNRFVRRPAEEAAHWLEKMEIQRLLKAGDPSWEKVDGSRLQYALKLKDYEPYLSPGEWRGVRATLTKLDDIERGLRPLKGIGLVSDAWTIISPGDHGVLRAVDRGVAGLQGAAIGAELLELNSLDAVPGLDVAIGVIDAGAAVYFGTEYVVQNWHAVTHVADTVAHAALSVEKTEVKIASGAVHAVTSSVRSIFRL